MTLNPRPLLLATAACAVLFLAHPPAAAQAPTPTAPVKFEVTFTDDKGRLVEGVRADELRLFVNGVEQKIAGVELEEKPVTYGLVVDNSGSLRTQFGAVVLTAQGFVANNRPGDEAFVVRFVHSEAINILQGLTSDTPALQKAVGEMYVERGQTALIDALYVSAEHLLKQRPQDTKRRRALVLLSDGEDRNSHYKTDQLLKLLRGTGVQIFCVGFVGELPSEQGFIMKSKRGQASDLLKRLATETGGAAFFPEKVPELQAAFAEVVKHLRAQHMVSFIPQNGLQLADVRKVELKVFEGPDGRKRKAVIRPWAAKDPKD